MRQEIITIGQDGSILLWQGHALSEVMQQRGWPHLTREPRHLLGPSATGQPKVGWQPDHVEWVWEHWQKVEVFTSTATGVSLRATVRPARGQTTHQWGRPRLEAGAAVELLFYHQLGLGAEVKLAAPVSRVVSARLTASFAVQRNLLIVSLSRSPQSRHEVWLEYLTPSGGTHFEIKQQVPFTSSKVPLEFPGWGIVAVIARRPQGYELCGYAECNAHRRISRQGNASLANRLTTWLAGREVNSWPMPDTTPAPPAHQTLPLDNWPYQTQNYLRTLTDEAQQILKMPLARAEWFAQDYLTGVARCLTLARGGFPPQDWVQRAQDLQQNTLAATFPALATALEQLTAWEEKDWAVPHGLATGLLGAVQAAAHQGPNALQKALEVLQTPTQPSNLSGQIFSGKYQILAPIAPGRGGMAEIYRATQLELDREVVIKVAQPSLSANLPDCEARFDREARLAGMFNDERIIRVYDFERKQGLQCAYIAMELVAGKPLDVLLSENRPCLDLSRALRLALNLCEGVAVVHSQQVVHRDLKPKNIMVLPSAGGQPERVKILDFGIAKQLSQPGPGLTVKGLFIGTFDYVAGEQLADFSAAGLEADVYSLGLILYELFSGKYPYPVKKRTAQEWWDCHAREPIIPLPISVPDQLKNIVHKALAKTPSNRYADASLLSQELRQSGQQLNLL